MDRKKLHIGITGQSGFIGSHLAGHIRVSDRFELVPFEKRWFDADGELRHFAERCDVIVHLAGLSRHEDGDLLYRVNMSLTERLAQAAASAANAPGVCFGSTVQIDKMLPYHTSKRDGGALLAARLSGRSAAVNMLMPNVFGPYSRPFYNSVVSTFCYLAARGRTPETLSDVPLQLCYVGDLCCEILSIAGRAAGVPGASTVAIPHRYEERLPAVWEKLCSWSEFLPAASSAAGGKTAPRLDTRFDCDLWTTFQSYRPV
ncbi:UDP-2-acetamido-2,6-beta-L-arabino-hexul-4-ose reductase [bioreactor metagenome]|uniref:UDP-2-acetamido-2,6-beta-L-arabino-hexul-4-ose reductase n=1 Tax=bioreactor metagenome TaxID=1076179 RepID=A0A644ZNX6_9ZZZZ